GWITTSAGNQLWAKKSLENGSEIISLINQDASSVTIDAEKINLSGNVAINGTIRNAFVKNDSTIYIGGTDPQLNLKQHDNVVAIQYNSGGWKTDINLPWNIEHSGRRVCIVNYKWGTAITTGTMEITAPSGKYFYEDGRSKSSLSFSREVVELLGYGDNATFFGWIVVNRLDIMTTGKYGSCQKFLAQGLVTVSKSGSTIYTSLKYKTYDGSTMSVTRMDTGQYRVHHNLGTSNYTVMLTGVYSTVEGTDREVFA
ncbi:hypothetical protein EZS27_040692, partial [termite gut metagenome]